MRRSVVKKLTGALCMLLICLVFTAGHTVFASLAREEQERTPYYKSIRIEEGDSLWEIASDYKDGSEMSTEEYVKQLKEMNCLKKDTIHAGQYLMVVYYE
jgi:cell division protein YceG involved in septum cleavage